MTQSEFFSGIENNLRRLTESRITLPDYNLPGLIRGEGYQAILRNMMKIKTLKKLTAKDPSTPSNVRVYDLISGGLPGVGKQKFRIFAAYVEEPTRDAYKEVKFKIRKWYQESGWADAVDKPYAGAMVVASGKSWPDGMAPNADDIPFPQVVFHVLSAPNPNPKLGIEMATLGDADVGAVIFRALGEDFEASRKRVEEYVMQQFKLPESAREGHLFVEDVADKTKLSEDDVSNIFNDMQADGKLTICKANRRSGSAVKSQAAAMYVVEGAASYWKRRVSKSQGAWYTKTGFCTISAGTVLYLIYLVFSALKNRITDLISGDMAILLYVIGGLAVTGCLLLAIKFILRNR